MNYPFNSHTLIERISQSSAPGLFIDELHINAGKQITYNYFDQNGFSIGFGYQLSKTLHTQLG
ncbi:DUF2490 domain-containing protein [Rhodocytophaga aerolata]|uniref:DUF2490 domain-containing protein n=1 Tax=Rhodocytophaga aerolata TaxID=455078 RepID=UPI003458ECDB